MTRSTMNHMAALAVCAVFCGAADSAEAVQISVANGYGVAGGRAEVPVSLLSDGEQVVATQVQFFFNPDLVDLSESADCSINPAISSTPPECADPVPDVPCKNLQVTLTDCANLTNCPPGPGPKRRANAVVISLDNWNVIPDGLLFTCSFRIAAALPPGTEALLQVEAGTGDRDGSGLPTTVNDAAIVVLAETATATPTLMSTATPVSTPGCPGDCGGNGLVGVEELIRGVRIALGLSPLDFCPSFDRNGDGLVRVNELIAAVSAALSGCPAAPPTATPRTSTPTQPLPTPERPTATSSATPSPMATRTPVATVAGPPRCGDGAAQTGEDCDDGNAFGGDGCAANCTVEELRRFLLTESSSAVLQLQMFSLPLELRGGALLAIGRARDERVLDPAGVARFESGQIPVAVPARDKLADADSRLDTFCFCSRMVENPIHGPGNAGSGVIGCGAAGLEDVDYVLTRDHHLDLEAEECAAAGGSVEPQTGAHPGVCNGPLERRSFGVGSSGSAIVSVDVSIYPIQAPGGICAYDPENLANGLDGTPCTADDPMSAPVTKLILTTGRAEFEVLDADNNLEFDIAPGGSCLPPCIAESQGAAFDCGAVGAGGGAGAVLGGGIVVIDSPGGDFVASIGLTGELGPALTLPPTASPTPTTPAPTGTATATPPTPACFGDCNDNGSVDEAELILCAQNSLTNGGFGYCLACDANYDGTVTVEEVNLAIEQFRAGCPGTAHTPRPTSVVESCSGDCNRDGSVLADEFVTCSGIALGNIDPVQCSACDLDGSGLVDMGELNEVARSVGCTSGPRADTPTPTSTPTPVVTFVPSGPLGRRLFSVNPGESYYLTAFGLSFGGFSGHLLLEAGEPDPINGAAAVDIVDASSYFSLSLLLGGTICLQPLIEEFPVRRAGLIDCDGGSEFGYAVGRDHVLGVIDTCSGEESSGLACSSDDECDGSGCFTADSCADAMGSPDAVHPGVCNGPRQVWSLEGNSGAGALLLAERPDLGISGLRVAVTSEVALPCGDEPGDVVVVMPFDLSSGIVRATIDDSGGVIGQNLVTERTGENFSCAQWSVEDGSGTLVHAQPAIDFQFPVVGVNDVNNFFVFSD